MEENIMTEDNESKSVVVTITDDKGRKRDKIVTRKEMEGFLYSRQWEPQYLNAVYALFNKMNSLSGFYRFCQCSNCAFNRYGQLCASRKRHCMSYENSGIGMTDEDKELLLHQERAVTNVSNGDVPLKTIYRCLLRDYHRAVDQLEEQSKTIASLPPKERLDDVTQLLAKAIDTIPNSKKGRSAQRTIEEAIKLLTNESLTDKQN